MIEDKSFNEFIKAKLEEDVGSIPSVDLSRCVLSSSARASRRSRFHPFDFSTFQPYLIAASLMIFCGLFVAHFPEDRERPVERTCEHPGEQATINAIDLLDGDQVTAASASYADRLVAWQDAPYDEILD